MNENAKPWYASRTLQGVALAVVGIIVGAVGSQEVGSALTVLGLGVAGIGRARADQPVRFKKSKRSPRARS